jgi:hypothetical protein
MTTHPINSLNPPFQTPQPDELQSEDKRKALLEEHEEKQSAESDPLENSEDGNAHDPAALLENMENLADRHLPSLDSPPG